MIGHGWLFDLYPVSGGIRLWFIGEDGHPLCLWEPYRPAFYVSGPVGTLQRALRTLRVPVAVTPVERVEFWTGRTVPVWEVQVGDPLHYRRVVAHFDRWEDGALDLFTYTIPVPQRYGYDRGVFPLAFCAWEATADGELTALEVRDDPWAVDYPLPPLRVLTVKLEGDLINPRHGHRGRLEISFNGDTHTRLLEGDDPRELLETLTRTLLRVDPDVILTHWGDAWLLPMLMALARRYRISLPWHRDPGAPIKNRKAHSYFSYGRIVRREAAQFLAGRWHLDAENTFLLAEAGFEGLLEIARLSRIPVQQVARTSTGTAISSLQLLEAHRRGILIPFRKQAAEGFKTAEELLTADKGGLVFVPEPGVYGNIAELDFTSLYPAIMARFNISPETLDCPCCPHHPVPELGRHTCLRRRGLVPTVLEPLLAKRTQLKALKNATTDPTLRQRYDRRQNALKWLLVTSFGYLGYKNFIFGKIEAHECVTAYSRDILLRAKELAEAEGFRVVHAIVDSIWVSKPGLIEEEVAALAETITEGTGIPIAVEGIYRWLLFPPSRQRPRLAVPNRFVGVFQDGSLKIRGLELRRHDTPPFIAQTQQAMLHVLARAKTPEELTRVLPDALTILSAAVVKIQEGRVPISHLAITKQISQDPDAYRRPSETAIAAQSLLGRGIRLAPGESVQFVITAAGDPDPASRVRPVTFDFAGKGYDREKYRELLLRAADSVLSPLGWNWERLCEQFAGEPGRAGRARWKSGSGDADAG